MRTPTNTRVVPWTTTPNREKSSSLISDPSGVLVSQQRPREVSSRELSFISNIYTQHHHTLFIHRYRTHTDIASISLSCFTSTKVPYSHAYYAIPYGTLTPSLGFRMPQNPPPKNGALSVCETYMTLFCMYKNETLTETPLSACVSHSHTLLCCILPSRPPRRRRVRALLLATLALGFHPRKKRRDASVWYNGKGKPPDADGSFLCSLTYIQASNNTNTQQEASASPLILSSDGYGADKNRQTKKKLLYVYV